MDQTTMATPTLRELPSIKRRVKPMLRWLKHVQDVYNECNAEFLKRPEVIEAFNLLYDQIQIYEHAYITEFPAKMYHYFSGIIPYHKVVAPYIRMFPRNTYYVFRHMYRDTFPLDGETIIPMAGITRSFRSRAEIETLLGVTSLKDTVYTIGSQSINVNITIPYKRLYDLVRAELEPILLQKMNEIASKYKLASIKKEIDHNHAKRDRVEQTYQQQIRSIETTLDALYHELTTMEKAVTEKTVMEEEKS